MTWTVEHWLEADETQELEYSAYWNDPEQERGKPWDVTGGDYGAVERYLGDIGLTEALESALIHARRLRGRGIRGTGVDIAAGTLWAAPLLLRHPDVARLVCVEYSRHRLLEIGPMMLEHYGVEPERVTLALGSFYDLQLADGSLDFAILSQAFHHADHPAELLAEIRRTLAPDGVAIITGEHRVRVRQYVLYAARVGLGLAPRHLRDRRPGGLTPARLRVPPRGADLEPTDAVLGDHAYTRSEYDAMFRAVGFRAARLPALGRHYQGFLLLPGGGA